MSIPTYYAIKVLEELSSDYIKNLITQVDARKILQEVNEKEENFPNFDPILTEKIAHISYTLISCGCSLVENKTSETTRGLFVLEKAGKLISDIYLFNDNELNNKDLHILIASMVLYASKQYSRAFIVLKDIKPDFLVGRLVFDFIRKDFISLNNNINDVLLSSDFHENYYENLSEGIITFEIARVFSIALDFVYSGNKESFKLIESILNKVQIIASEDNLVSYWLIIRLLKIIFNTFNENSLWSVLPPLISKKSLVDKYIRLLSFFKSPVLELWPSQTVSLPMALGDNDGAVINLRTSAGKTRIAEISILKTLSADVSSKVLYLAPFRSLAFEIEQSLNKTFSPLGFRISQLYGGSTANLTDLELITQSQIIIATPEKAKALIRSGSGIENELNLIIIDEGHLLGPNERNIRNEMFFTHIKNFAVSNGIRILLLSAVLPNANELAQWIAGNERLAVKSDWKPSLERKGLLLWNGSRVRLEWKSNGNPFNPNFIQSKPLGFSRRRNPFPNNKNEAVAATAVKLSTGGTVMIYSARANSIEGLAKNVLLALGDEPKDHHWNKSLWNIFENICKEELRDNSVILKAAKKGIICHNNKLPRLVRIAIERLMRSKPPLIIIASSTLAQGVNIGVTSIIVSTPYYGTKPISTSDFWNICGRAGRAFGDIEGKVLYAIDTQVKTREDQWRVNKDFTLADKYFDNSKLESARSGIMIALKEIMINAEESEINFDVLLEAIANDFIESDIPFVLEERINEIFDYMDDELLAMHVRLSSDESLSWVDDVFRKSLALIQAEQENKDKFIDLLKARTNAILVSIPRKSDRERIVRSGTPLSVSKAIIEDIDYFHEIGFSFIDESYGEENKIEILSEFVKKIEVWCNKKAKNIVKPIPEQSQLDRVRSWWIGGQPLKELREKNSEIDKISKGYYGFTLPWIVHAISQIFDPLKDDDIRKLYSRTALFIELGLPNEVATNIYLSGVHSRSSALELSNIEFFNSKSITDIKKILVNRDFCETTISNVTLTWVRIISEIHQADRVKNIAFPKFTWRRANLPKKLYPKEFNGKCYLMSKDGYFKEVVESSVDLPFKLVSNIIGLYFENADGQWTLKSYSPFIEIS